jgi:hypothetical protein
MEETAEVVRHYLLYFVMPFWLIIGFCDYVCHRRTKIEQTSGAIEAAIHLLMLTEVGIPIALGLYLEINSLIIALMIVAFLAHEITSLCDVAYAEKRREITLFEQHVHSYLAVIPFMVGSFVICLYWDQFLALFGAGQERADFAVRWKQMPVPLEYHVGLGTAVLGLLVLPYTEELWRCWRAARSLSISRNAAPRSL